MGLNQTFRHYVKVHSEFVQLFRFAGESIVYSHAGHSNDTNVHDIVYILSYIFRVLPFYSGTGKFSLTVLKRRKNKSQLLKTFNKDLEAEISEEKRNFAKLASVV
ncbi:hypothetical protein BaRGS_00011664 [Batillaria attramentaria]|uniref:LAGLIDADG endonuclease n=1 Tax=Batillaria attramentaria TaxID=370345 RepID=A0ABD0LCG3_9CAEN